LTTSSQSFLTLANRSFKFRLYLLLKLPAAFFSGITIISINEEKCITSVPYKWLTQNPFRSTYFASLAMAAEMSTGALALSNIYKRTPPVSMLVTKMEAVYYKKATGKTFFTCENGKEFSATVDEAIASGQGKTLVAASTGIDSNGERVAEFFFTWSFKAKAIPAIIS
jgi:Domain of unknown function (DUF4442)